MSKYLSSLPGADHVIAWFGQWPSFHDAEVWQLDLVRNGSSRLVVETWLTSNTLDGHGQYERQRRALVTFHLEEITDLEIIEFGPQNVVARLDIEPDSEGWRLTLYPCYGVHGYIRCGRVRLGLEELSG